MPFSRGPQAETRQSKSASRLLVQELGRPPVFPNWGSAYKKMTDDQTRACPTIGENGAERQHIRRRAIMVSTPILELAIQKELGRVYLCTLEELCTLLPQFSSDQIIVTVERLAREGAVACRSSEPSRTILWLPPTRPGRPAVDQPTPTEPPLSLRVGLEHESWTDTTSSSGHL